MGVVRLCRPCSENSKSEGSSPSPGLLRPRWPQPVSGALCSPGWAGRVLVGSLCPEGPVPWQGRTAPVWLSGWHGAVQVCLPFPSLTCFQSKISRFLTWKQHTWKRKRYEKSSVKKRERSVFSRLCLPFREEPSGPVLGQPALLKRLFWSDAPWPCTQVLLLRRGRRGPAGQRGAWSQSLPLPFEQ